MASSASSFSSPSLLRSSSTFRAVESSFASPLKKIVEVVKKNDISKSLNLEDKIKIQEGLEYLKSLKDSTAKTSCENVNKAILDTIKGNEYSRISGSDFLANCLKSISRIYKEHGGDTLPWIINEEHIFAPEFVKAEASTEGKGITSKKPQKKPKGFHFNPTKSGLDRVVINSKTGVFSGFFDGKFSTFFPDNIERHQLIALLQSAKIEMRHENTVLCSLSGRSFYIVMFLREMPFVQSAFPLHVCVTYSPEMSPIHITETFSITASQTIVLAKTLLNSVKPVGKHPIKFFTDKEIVVEMAEILSLSTTIEQGIYVRFPINVFKDEPKILALIESLSASDVD